MRRLLFALWVVTGPLCGSARADIPELRPELRPAPPVVIGADHQLVFDRPAPPLVLPTLGPVRAAVTLELGLPFGTVESRQALALALRLQAELPDLRLVYVPGSGNARGLAALWEAWRQRRFWDLCVRLHDHPELAAADAPLRAAATAVGLAAERVVEAARRPFPVELQRLLERRGPRSVEFTINGQPLRGPLSEGQLRDEIARARLRPTDPRPTPRPPLDSAPWERRLPYFPGVPGAGPGMALGAVFGDRPGRREPRLSPPLAGAPTCGPAIATVTLLLLGTFESYRSYGYTIAAREVFRQREGRVRLVFLHARSGGVFSGSSGPAGKPALVTLLLAQIQRQQPARFWAALDALTEVQGREVHVGEVAARRALAQAGFDVNQLLAGLADGGARRLIEADQEKLRAAGLNEPALLLNGRVLPSAPGIRGLSVRVQDEEDRGLLSRIFDSAPRSGAPFIDNAP